MTAPTDIRRHPETGEALTRGTRALTLTYRGESTTIEMQGWYPSEDPTADHGLHERADTEVSDAAIVALKLSWAGGSRAGGRES